MVKDPADYIWSSYKAHAFGQLARLWTPHPEYLSLASERLERQARYRQLFSQQLDQDVINQIRNNTNTGLVLGTDAFRKQVENLTGGRFHLLRRGPKKKREDRQT
ncbi:MAG: hypothetical protein WD002_12175 [Pseudomonadales bacterium]